MTDSDIKNVQNVEIAFKNKSAVLSPTEEKIIITECNLGQYKKTVSRPYIEANILHSFFQDDNIFVTADTFSIYLHNLLQFNIDKFFGEKKFSKIYELAIRDGESITQTRKSKIKYDINKYFDAYSEAYLFYKNKNGQKLCVKIEKRYGANVFYYELFSTGQDDNTLQEWQSYSSKNNFYKGKKLNADCSFLDLDVDIKWNDIILDETIKKVIQNNIENLFSMSDLLKINSIRLKRGVILTGSPGVGKTLVCKVLANELKTTVVYVLPTHIKEKSDVARICDMAKDLAPTLLILEDIDYIAEDRDSQGGWSVIDLMNKMDGLEGFEDVITLATTNMIEKVENAIKNRPGRFDRVIKIENPSTELTVKMLEKFTENFIIEKVDFKKMTKETIGMSGAHIKDLCITAALIALQDKSMNKNKKVIIKTDHFIKAIKEINNKDFSQAITNRPKESMGFGPAAIDRYGDYEED